MSGATCLRRLLDDLQERVEGRNGQHVDLIDDVHTLFHLAGGVNGIVAQIADVVNAVVGGGVDLQNIHAGARIDGLTGLADIAGIAVVGIQAVDRLAQNLGAAGLTRTTGARKQIRMAHVTGQKLCLQRLRHSPLPHNIIESLGTIFTI